ncbi:hypothetical protein [Burkholderia diffusa]|nr:hypothetical protein [Burkholderia diffusa]
MTKQSCGSASAVTVRGDGSDGSETPDALRDALAEQFGVLDGFVRE